jgi:hypothetical protein
LAACPAAVNGARRFEAKQNCRQNSAGQNDVSVDGDGDDAVDWRSL